MATATLNPYRLKKPCPPCPFRSDVEKYLRADRAKEIADALYDGAGFPCHNTTEDAEDEDGMGIRVETEKSAQCAGALITMEKEGYSNQQVRIAERLGMYDPTALAMDAPVYDSLAEWAQSYEPVPFVMIDGEKVEYEYCGICDYSCENPAGYGMGGGAARNTDPPACHPVNDVCNMCGTPMCPACTSETPNLCAGCEEEDPG